MRFNKYQQKQSAIQETTRKNTSTLLPYSQMIHHPRALLKTLIPVSVTDLKHYQLGLAKLVTKCSTPRKTYNQNWKEKNKS